jgi:DNA primase
MRERRTRLFALLDQAAAYYERTLWETSAGGWRATISRDWPRRGDEPRVPAALGGNSLARKAYKGFNQDELRAAGLTRQRGDDYFAGRLLFPLADRQGRVLGFQARGLHEDDPQQAKYAEHPRVGAVPQGWVVYGLDKASFDRPRRPSVRRRRQHRRDRPSSVWISARGRVDGTALTEQQLKELARLDEAPLARLRRRCGRRDRDPARDEPPRGSASTSKVVALAPGIDPADDPRGFERRLPTAEPYILYRVRIEIERADDRERVSHREVAAR